MLLLSSLHPRYKIVSSTKCLHDIVIQIYDRKINQVIRFTLKELPFLEDLELLEYVAGIQWDLYQMAHENIEIK